MTNVSVHVERVVLEDIGFSPIERRYLTVALQAELSRLLSGSETGWGAVRSMALRSLRVQDIQLGSQVRPVELGRQIARALHNGVIK